MTKNASSRTCSNCGKATRRGHSELRLGRDGVTLLIESVPADVCPACGESYIDGRLAERLTAVAGRAVEQIQAVLAAAGPSREPVSSSKRR